MPKTCPKCGKQVHIYRVITTERFSWYGDKDGDYESDQCEETVYHGNHIITSQNEA